MTSNLFYLFLEVLVYICAEYLVYWNKYKYWDHHIFNYPQTLKNIFHIIYVITNMNMYIDFEDSRLLSQTAFFHFTYDQRSQCLSYFWFLKMTRTGEWSSILHFKLKASHNTFKLDFFCLLHDGNCSSTLYILLIIKCSQVKSLQWEFMNYNLRNYIPT